MYRFALSLCGEHLSCVTAGRESCKSEEICGWVCQWSHLHFEARVARDELFEEKASWLLSILFSFCFFFLEINTFAPNFVRLAIDPLPLPPLALRWLLLPRAAKAHCEFVLSSRTLFFVSLFCCMKVTYALQRHYCECSKGGCTFMTCTYSLQLSVLLVLLQHNRVPIFSVSAGESRKSDESCVRNGLEFFCETFALARRHSEEKALPPLSASASPCPRPTCWDLVGTVSLILTYKKQKAAEEKQ